MTTCNCSAYSFPHRLGGGYCAIPTAVAMIHDKTGVTPDRRDLEDISGYWNVNAHDAGEIAYTFFVEADLAPSHAYQEVEAADCC